MYDISHRETFQIRLREILYLVQKLSYGLWTFYITNHFGDFPVSGSVGYKRR